MSNQLNFVFGLPPPSNSLSLPKKGPTSNTTFLHHIITSIKDLRQSYVLGPVSDDVTVIPRAISPPPTGGSIKSPSAPSCISTDSSALPPYEEIVRLLDIYFTNTGSMFPYLDESIVLGYLGNGQSAQWQKLSPVQLCLINTCMAFASVHGDPGSDREDKMQNASIYFQRAQSMLPEVVAKNASLDASKIP